jgi:hypothetical protein
VDIGDKIRDVDQSQFGGSKAVPRAFAGSST